MPRKPRFETMCRTCGCLVGVWQTPYNRSGRGATQGFAPVPKTSKHRDAAGRPCLGGLLSIDPRTMIPAKDTA